MRYLYSPTLLLLALVFLQGPAWTAEDGDEETPAQVYVTATVKEKALSSATAAITVIEREEIDTLAVDNVADVLRFVPGITITEGGARGGFTTAQIRGGDPNFTLILLDGVPLNDATYQVGDAYDLAGIPLAIIERIEIVRGPLSSFFGATGLAGVINLITTPAPGKQPRAPRTRTGLEAGDADRLRADASLSGMTAKFGYTLGFAYEREKQRIAADHFRLFSVNGSLVAELSPLAAVTVTSRYTDWEAGDYPDASGGPLLGDGMLRESQNEELQLAATLELGKKKSHKIHAAWYRHRLDRTSPAVFPLVPSSDERTTLDRLRIGWQGNLWRGDHYQINAGVDTVHEKGVNESVLFIGFPLPGNYDLTRDHAGAFTELFYQRNNFVWEMSARVDVPDNAATQLSPRLGFSYTTNRGHTRFHSSAGRAFKLPSFFALASPPALGGNPDLRPETALGADLGVNHRFEEQGLELGLTLFRNEFENLVDFDFQSFLHVNRAEVEAQGAELTFTWQPEPRFFLDLNLTRQKVEDPQTGETLRHRPDWTGGGRLSWTPLPQLRLQLDARGISESRDEQIPVPERMTVPGHTVFGFSSALELGPAWRIHLRAENLADKSYETAIGFPGAERSFKAGVRWLH